MRPRHGGGVEICVVHRPRYDDWSLPKGKLDPGEDWADAALREVEEETGLRCALEDELPPTDYEVGGRAKRVRWWRMRVVEDRGAAARDDEVDELRWVTREEADDLLDYDADRALVAAALG
jgi:8-oxo-dGTP diphosphatase